MKTVNWLVVASISAVVILLLFGAGMMIMMMRGGWGMMVSPGMMGWHGIMGNWGYSPFGWVGMLFMWLIPAGLVALIALGVVWLAQKSGNSTPPSS